MYRSVDHARTGWGSPQHPSEVVSHHYTSRKLLFPFFSLAVVFFLADVLTTTFFRLETGFTAAILPASGSTLLYPLDFWTV